jgi:hypothetical protein
MKQKHLAILGILGALVALFLIIQAGRGFYPLSDHDPVINSICRLDLPADPDNQYMTFRFEQTFLKIDYDAYWGEYTRGGHVVMEIRLDGPMFEWPYEVRDWWVPVESKIEEVVPPIFEWDGQDRIKVHWSRTIKIPKIWEDADILLSDTQIVDRWQNPVCSSSSCGQVATDYPFIIAPGQATYNGHLCVQLEDLTEHAYLPYVFRGRDIWARPDTDGDATATATATAMATITPTATATCEPDDDDDDDCDDD